MYIGQWHFSPLQSRHLWTLQSFPSMSSTIQNTLQNSLLQSPSAALSYFPESHLWSPISSLSKVILVLGKARSHRLPNLGCSGAGPPGWFEFSLKHSAWDMMHEWVWCRDEAANHQLPIAAAFWIILIFSTEGCSNLMQNLMQISCSPLSVNLNARATWYRCSLNGIYAPRGWVQWSHCWPMHNPALSSWLPGSIDVVRTVLGILTMIKFFQTDLIHSSLKTCLHCFYILTVDNATMNIGLQILLWGIDFISFGYIQKRLLDHMVVLFLVCWESLYYFS